jgi:RNA polymerase sigma-70 factor (ECF subfamily)
MVADLSDPFRAGQQAWPTIVLDEDRFRRALDAAGGATGHAADLYLACAAALGVPEAVAAFDREYIARVPQFVAHMNLQEHALDELGQRLREWLLLPRGDRPAKLTEYGGRGSLLSWLRVVAVRAAVDQLRGEQRHAADPLDRELPFLGIGGDEPELQLLRTRYRPRFREALEAAASTLTPRERNVLRMSLVDGLTFEQIAPLFRVTKSTVHRWLGEAQRRLLREVRRFFRDQVGLSASELDSVARLLQSQVDFSLPSLLRTK